MRPQETVGPARRAPAILLLAALALAAGMRTGAAQSIDELPPDVFKAASALERHCEGLGGRPDYEPLELVTFVFFGDDWDNGGRESYVIDTSRFACPGAPEARPFCAAQACRLIVMSPKGRSGFAKGLDRMASAWRLIGANAASNGPNVLLQTTENGANLLFRATKAGMARTGPSGD